MNKGIHEFKIVFQKAREEGIKLTVQCVCSECKFWCGRCLKGKKNELLILQLARSLLHDER